MNEEEYETLQAEISVNLYVCLIAGIIVSFCIFTDKILSETGLYLYFVLCLVFTLFFCVVLHRHISQKLNPSLK